MKKSEGDGDDIKREAVPAGLMAPTFAGLNDAWVTHHCTQITVARLL